MSQEIETNVIFIVTIHSIKILTDNSKSSRTFNLTPVYQLNSFYFVFYAHLFCRNRFLFDNTIMLIVFLLKVRFKAIRETDLNLPLFHWCFFYFIFADQKLYRFSYPLQRKLIFYGFFFLSVVLPIRTTKENMHLFFVFWRRFSIFTRFSLFSLSNDFNL